jgi:hypothetical protein
MRCLAVAALVLATACSAKPADAPPDAGPQPADSQHAGITTPHGDHSPPHGGRVLMNGETHYEVVFDKGGRHRVWFSNAVREDLPASIAAKVVMVVTREKAPPETLALAIDDSGESWLAAGMPLTGGEVVKLTYSMRGEPFEIEIPVP